MTLRHSRTITAVQAPIIPVVAEWTKNTPNTLSLGQGMVFYSPPEQALAAIRDFGQRPEEHQYSAALGDKRLLDLLAEKLRSENQINSADYQIMVTAGANMAFLNVLLAITDPDDEIILPSPYYFNQEMAIRMLNCKPVAVPTDCRYQLKLDAIEAAITEKTRAIVTVSPNNPSGAVYSEDDLRAVNTLCRERDLYHICDEAYEYFVYGSAKHFSPASLPSASSHTISLYSLSKAYGFASWRVGYVVFPKELLPALLKVQDTNLICPPLICQQAAIGALNVGSSYCKTQLQRLLGIREQVIKRLQDVRDHIDFVATEGAFYFLLKLHTQRSDLDVVKTLIQDYQVSAIPGCAFGLTDGCYLRLSYAMLDNTRADQAMTRLITGIKHITAF
ncbi:pyridoxal phosphate-dependent aminotransferase [Methylobacter luteus]|uniref:pyridoxal phosphate-dependent aminotransferase n=1 Tax=Methylobacter luteus TaxID=415 RepID=UPI0004847736|nr:pyridoxal phosphate-dependent aminotransferase [Methylobacter luteus]